MIDEDKASFGDPQGTVKESCGDTSLKPTQGIRDASGILIIPQAIVKGSLRDLEDSWTRYP